MSKVKKEVTVEQVAKGIVATLHKLKPDMQNNVLRDVLLNTHNKRKNAVEGAKSAYKTMAKSLEDLNQIIQNF